MFQKLYSAAILLFLMVPPLQAQATSGSVQFNLLSYEGAYLSRAFNFDDAYTQKYGIPVSAAFRVAIPMRDDVELIADGQPDTGFVKFTFATKDPEGRKFIENFHVFEVTFGVPEGASDPDAARLQMVAQAMKEQVLPQVVKGFADVELIGLREIEVGGVASVELVAIYTDPDNGPMVLQMAGLPNPDSANSYLVVHNLSRTLVPISGPEQLPETLGGRVLMSFQYQ